MVKCDEITIRIKINKSNWAAIKSMAVYRRQSVQKFSGKLLNVAFEVVNDIEYKLEDALDRAEKGFIDNGFRIIRGGAIIFRQDRILHIELLKNDIHYHITFKGIWAIKEPNFKLGINLWKKEDLHNLKLSESEIKDLNTFIEIGDRSIIEGSNLWELIKEYSKLGIGKEIVRIGTYG